MLTIWVTVGLPASGKSTWAEKTIAEFKSGAKRVNKDDLRAMIDGGRWSQDNEKLILKIRDRIIYEALDAGKHVIVDDTNLCQKHVDRFHAIAAEYRKQGKQVKVEIIDFTHVDVETCIERDLKRTRSVGERVIRKMYRDYLQPKAVPPTHNPALPDCVIIDLDGTIALNNGHRGWYDYSTCYNDEVNWPVVDAIQAFLDFKGCTPVFVSGREETCEEQTRRFIVDKTGLDKAAPFLFMRKAGDNRDDRIVKRELYETHILGRWNVLHVWDDRAKVCEMWRDLGMTVFAVAEGNF